MSHSSRRPVAYYISAHGYGHGVRSCDILRALHRARPDIPVIISSDLPESFLRHRLGETPATIRKAAFDVGMVQRDSIRVDVVETLRQIEALYARRPSLRDAEVRFLKEIQAGLVVVDIPALPLEAAAALAVPRLAVANFAWDWIYSAFAESDPRWDGIIRQIQDGYRQTDLLLRLPFSEELKIFPRREDLPLLASPGRNRRPEIASLTGTPKSKKWVLLSFSTLDWDEAALRNVERMSDYEFFSVLPLQWPRKNFHALDRARVSFSDVMASVDIVISKPGFGLLSDCIVNSKPLVYAERTDFIEYPILERAVKQYLRHRHLPAEKLYRGELREALDEIEHSPPPPDTMKRGGDDIAARRLLDYYSRQP